MKNKTTTKITKTPKIEKKTITVCEGEIISFKDLQLHMEHPFFSLSKRPNFTEVRYENGSNWIEISPSSKGRATIYDKDILVYLTSQIRMKVNNNEPITRHIDFNIRDYLRNTNRSISGRAYKLFIEALDRLDGTRIKTNIAKNGEIDTARYGIIEGYDIKRMDDKQDGKIMSCVITLSSRMFQSIAQSRPAILTVNPKIFELRKPTQKRIYDIARKHVGKKESWKIKIKKLAVKMGSNTATVNKSEWELRRKIKELIFEHQIKENYTFPDFIVLYDKEKDIVTFLQKQKWWSNTNDKNIDIPLFDTVIFDEAKTIAPSCDIYSLKAEFDKWIINNKEKFTFNKESLQKAFLGFCRKKQEKQIIQKELF